MRKEELKELVEKYFSSPPANIPKWSFSAKWKTAVYREVDKEVKAEYDAKDVVKIISCIHIGAFQNLFDQLKTDFKFNWKNIDPSEVEDVVMVAWTNFTGVQNKYDPNKGKSELQYLSWRINKDLINKSKKKNTTNLNETVKHWKSDDEEDDVSVIEPIAEDIKFEYGNYLQELRDTSSASLVRVAAHLFAVKPNHIDIKNLSESYIKHSFPSRDFLLKDIPADFQLFRNMEDYRLDVLGYARYERIVESEERKFMMLAIEKLKECRIGFDTQLDKMVKAAKEQGLSVNIEQLKERYPLLSAVAVDKNGDIIKTAFKGETGCIEKHCEYTLFEELFSDIDKERIKGGTLYVTLEPCNRRGLNKIPCAVRCVEAGLSRIYIGTHDPDLSVKWNGATTLKTGAYTFNVDDVGNPTEGNAEAAKILMKKFDDKSYSCTLESGKKTYKIGNRVEVRLFHPDLSLEIIQLNKEFLKGKERNAFVSFDMPEYF